MTPDGAGEVRNKWVRTLLLAFAILYVFAHAAQADCETRSTHTATVIRVVDGQTLRLDDGSEARLIGALAPETPLWWKGDKVWPPAGWSRRALQQLAGSQKVELRFADGEPQRDRHGRFLAQLYVLRGEERIWVQGHMIGEGYAQAYSFARHRACARALQAREARARSAHNGLWRKGRFTVRQTAGVEALSKRHGSFQLVEGRVHSVGRTSQWTFLNFSGDWRRDFTVAIRARDRHRFKDSDVSLDALEGKIVRVRGWLERWNGPVIKATHPEQIEVLEEMDGAGSGPL